MKAKIMLLITLLSVIAIQAQVGVGTTAPNATLDVRSSNQATPANTDGILIPKIDDFPATNPTTDQDGMLVYITGASTAIKGFYYWNNASLSWVSITGVQRIDDLFDGKSDNDGTNNGSSIFLGIGAGASDDGTDNQNLGFGLGALQNNISGMNNMAIGNSSLFNNTTGNFNMAIGRNSMINNTTGIGNKAFGTFALANNTIGSNNLAFGGSSLVNNISGNLNVGYGVWSLRNNISGSNNVALGTQGLNNNIIGSNNTAIGNDALFSSLGFGNVALGYQAGYNETGSGKLYIENSNADENNALIYGEFGNNNSNTGNILRTNSRFQIGNPTLTGYAFPTLDGAANQILQTNGSGALNWVDPNITVIHSLNDLVDGKSDNDGTNDGSSIFLGISAGANDDSSNNRNIGVGFRALQNNTTGQGNVAIGFDVMYSNTIGYDNTVNGYRALYLNTIGYQNTAVGYASLYSNTTGYQNTANGYYSLFSNTTGWFNTAYGNESLFSNTSGILNTAIGQESLFSNTTGSYNLASGYEALYSNTVGSGNVALGYRAGYNETGSNKLYIENTDTNPNTSLIYGEFGPDNTTTGNILRTNSEFQIGNPTLTGYAFPTIDGGANQVLQTDGNGALGWVNDNIGTDDQNLTAATLTGNTLQIDIENGSSTSVDLGVFADADNLGNHTATTDLGMSNFNVLDVNYVSTRPVSSYDKLRVWNTGNFTIGLHSAMTYGFLNDYAMSFTMNEDTDRGWIWRDNNDAQNDGAMSLTTNGRLTLKSDLRVDGNTLSVDAVNNRVGIATQSPSASLHVNHPNGAGSEGIVISNQTDADEWRIYQQWSSNTLALFFNNTNVGNFDDVSGTYTPVSDRRLKNNITSFNNALDDVKKLNVVNYQFSHQLDNRNYVGLLAQEVQTIFPHLVYKNTTEEDDQLTMDYSGFGVIAIKAIQEQQELIDSQQSQIDQLIKELQEIKALIKND